MPNFDGGHYFLTTLAPIKTGSVPGEGISYVQRLREALSNLPTAHQSPATVNLPDDSPFMRSLRTHLCRFVVIDDTVFNGRNSPNPLLVSAGVRDDPIAQKPVDTLPCAYLMFVVDFDAIKNAGDDLPDELTEAEQEAIRDDYLQDLWRVASGELSTIYENCQAFDAVKSPEEFARYLARCQIETWMSFNDYYLTLPTLEDLPLRNYAIAIGIPAAISALSFVSALFGSESGPMGLLFLLITIGIAYGIYRKIVANGKNAWPAAEYADLPSVLKGLYLQQRFSDFMVETQGKDAGELHAAFGQFVEQHTPRDKLRNTQAPGVIKS